MTLYFLLNRYAYLRLSVTLAAFHQRHSNLIQYLDRLSMLRLCLDLLFFAPDSVRLCDRLVHVS